MAALVLSPALPPCSTLPAANTLVLVRDRDGRPVEDENGYQLWRRACEAGGLASGEPAGWTSVQ